MKFRCMVTRTSIWVPGNGQPKTLLLSAHCFSDSPEVVSLAEFVEAHVNLPNGARSLSSRHSLSVKNAQFVPPEGKAVDRT